ncbi:MAG: precorrin-3B C(17)-methyltransferase [Desulfobulbus propionicus]|nr:MAG: precorrin-3B C(17)-methyltransferase [Desulfobulbus propionicus]
MGRDGCLSVVGTGPGALDLIAPRAEERIRTAGVVIGYRTYLELIEPLIGPDAEVAASTMMQEMDRCRLALELAENGQRVALVCGGDPGIYAMAGLVFELATETGSTAEIEVIPGIPALGAAAALLGAPLMHDFAVISLSDLLTPMELIEVRLVAAAQADFVTALYNPRSKKRTSQLPRARDIFLGHRSGSTPVGIVTGANRQGQAIRLCTLEGLPVEEVGMQSIVIIGNSTTFTHEGWMITPRGYHEKYGIGR